MRKKKPWMLFGHLYPRDLTVTKVAVFFLPNPALSAIKSWQLQITTESDLVT